jgi:2'-5' RNA ligase
MPAMRINAAIQPPDYAVEHLTRALDSLGLADSQIDWVPQPLWLLPLATFGNVALRDAQELENLLVKEMGKVEPMEMRLAEVTPLPEDGDDSVWVGWDGDTDEMKKLASAIPVWVRPFGFLLDRRSFRLRMRVARVTPQTTVFDLERIAERLGHYQGPEWLVEDVTLGRPRRNSDGVITDYDIDSRVHLGSAEAESSDRS